MRKIINSKSRILFLKSYWHLAISLVILVAPFIMSTNNDYMRDRQVDVSVIGKQPEGRQLYLAVSSPEWGIFPVLVDPATYYVAKQGDVMTFQLRPFDIRQNPRDNTIFFFGAGILWSLFIAYIVMLVIVFFWKDEDSAIGGIPIGMSVPIWMLLFSR